MKRTRVTTRFKRIEEVIVFHFEGMIKHGGKLSIYFLTLAFVTALYIKIFPNINEYLQPIFSKFSLDKILSPSDLLMTISLFSVVIFFLLVFISALIHFFKIVLKIICFFLNYILRFLQKLLIQVGLKKIAKRLSSFLQFYKNDIYFNERWIAKSKSETRQLEVPIKIKDFKYIRYEVLVHSKIYNHWRAGVIFRGPQRREYIFHLHEDYFSPGVLRSRIVFRIPEREEKDVRNTVDDTNTDQFTFEVKNQNNKLCLYVNMNLVNSFEVPLKNIHTLIIQAWADDKPFNIEFKNIEAMA